MRTPAGSIVRRVAAPMLLLVLAPLVAIAQSVITVPHTSVNLPFSSAASAQVVTVDLGSLPPRPVLAVEIEVAPSHPDAQFSVTVGDFVGYSVPAGSFCGASSPTFVSPTGAAPLRFEVDLYTCDPTLGTWLGETANVTVEMVDFGAAGSPASARIRVDAYTQVIDGTIAQQVSGVRTVSHVADADATLYEYSNDMSNGAGQSLWTGVEKIPIGTGVQVETYALHGLLRFGDFADDLPSNAIVLDAQLDLRALDVLGNGGLVSLWGVEPGVLWYEGSADPVGDEYRGVIGATGLLVDWDDRTWSTPWANPGGDVTTSVALEVVDVSAPGPVVFTGAGLVAGAQAMVDEADFDAGFQLRGPFTIGGSTGVRFSSSEGLNPNYDPVLTLTFDQSAPAWEDDLDTGAVDFMNEGQNFRWLYDADDDGIVSTDIGGLCITDFPSMSGQFQYPYSYDYTGDPGFVGVDCCSWQITSAESQTVGTGQALFFHDLDPADPANMPPDSDGDGIADLCDNCDWTPNGPSLGSCVDAAGVLGVVCTSVLDCAPGEACQLGQEDADFDGRGDACAVPEPGFGLGLLLGAGALSRRGRARRSTRPLL